MYYSTSPNESLYCTCSKKKMIVTRIDSQRVEVCSKRLGGCGKEIGHTGIDYSNKRSIKLNRSMIGKKFLTREGEAVKLIQVVESDPYPYIFEIRASHVITTTDEGKYSLTNEHKYDIVEVL